MTETGTETEAGTGTETGTRTGTETGTERLGLGQGLRLGLGDWAYLFTIVWCGILQTPSVCFHLWTLLAITYTHKDMIDTKHSITAAEQHQQEQD